MARFEFRLKALLAVREVTRAERRIDLATAIAAHREVEKHRESLQRDLSDERLRCRVSSGQVDIAAWQAADRFASMLRSRLVQFSQREQALAQDIDRLTWAVVEADRDVRSLEKLRQRKLEQFQQSEVRLEAKRLDEAAARAHRSD